MSRKIYPSQNRLIQEQATTVLGEAQRRFGLSAAPPILADFVAQALFSLKCRSRSMQPFGQRAVAALSLDDQTIYFDEHCPFPRRNFAIAHELGHFILHQGNASIPLAEPGDKPVSLHRVLRSYPAKTEKEKTRLREIEPN
jgi:hypothetical protein